MGSQIPSSSAWVAQALGLCHLRLDFNGKTLALSPETLGNGAWCDAVEAAVLQMREHEVAEAWAPGIEPQATTKETTGWLLHFGNVTKGTMIIHCETI